MAERTASKCMSFVYKENFSVGLRGGPSHAGSRLGSLNVMDNKKRHPGIPRVPLLCLDGQPSSSGSSASIVWTISSPTAI